MGGSQTAAVGGFVAREVQALKATGVLVGAKKKSVTDLL